MWEEMLLTVAVDDSACRSERALYLQPLRLVPVCKAQEELLQVPHAVRYFQSGLTPVLAKRASFTLGDSSELNGHACTVSQIPDGRRVWKRSLFNW